MGAPAKTTRARKAAGGTVRRAPDINDVPAELRDFYARPNLEATDDDEASLDFDTSAPAAKVPTEKLFSIDGVEYRIPAYFPPGFALIYLNALDEGRDIAVGRALKRAIGATGWAALVTLAEERPDLLTPGQFKRLMGIVMRKIMGTIEDSEGNG